MATMIMAVQVTTTTVQIVAIQMVQMVVAQAEWSRLETNHNSRHIKGLGLGLSRDTGPARSSNVDTATQNLAPPENHQRQKMGLLP